MRDLRAARRQGVCQRLGSPGGRIHLLWLLRLKRHSHSQLPECGGQWGWQLRGQPGHPLLPPGQLQTPNPGESALCLHTPTPRAEDPSPRGLGPGGPVGGRAFSSAARGSGSLLPAAQDLRGLLLLRPACHSCLSPRLEGRGGAGLRGEGRVRPSAATHTSPALSSLLEPPELQHHVTWDLPGRGGGRGPCSFLTSCLPLPCRGKGFEAKEKYPFIFSSMFCFLFF